MDVKPIRQLEGDTTVILSSDISRVSEYIKTWKDAYQEADKISSAEKRFMKPNIEPSPY